MEKWRPVKGYEGLYEISNKGRIQSTRRQGAPGGIKKLTVNQDGYHRVKLCKDGVEGRKMVHRLVYEAFVGEIPDGYEINHIDENKQNNVVENLEAITHIENIRHGTGIARMRKNLGKAVCQYTQDGKLIATYTSIKEAGEKSVANRSNICWCCRGHIETAGGYVWKYAQEGNK